MLVVSSYPLVEREREFLFTLFFLFCKSLMAISMPTTTTKLNFLKLLSSSSPSTKRVFLKPVHCAPPLQQQEDVRIMCEPCGGRGWLLCDFCNGEKTNVKAGNNRIYRRCPSCRAIGYVLCSQCKVYKCVTFPNFSDGESA